MGRKKGSKNKSTLAKAVAAAYDHTSKELAKAKAKEFIYDVRAIQDRAEVTLVLSSRNVAKLLSGESVTLRLKFVD